ncbi:MAG: hypothetical protein PHS53_03540 [Candidatus Pacebacteria bacterium]|nr:hypothetical protein [Candidatus Paceibacterota bacterium]MDD5357190.1 hypothetical protein [Candidatus Paceibacterota bacterium]
MFKEFLMRKMLASKMKGVPEAEQEKMLKMIEKNPELFQKIALEVQEKIKGEKDQMSATMEVMKSYESELRSIL